MRDGKTGQLNEDADEAERLQRWDAEIEADYQRTVAATKAGGKTKRGNRHMGAPWSFWAALTKTKVPWLAVILGVYIYRRTLVTGTLTVTVPRAELDELGIDRYQRSRALRRLESAGVIQTIKTGAGHSPRVKLLLR
jgi:hypothetical protein